VNRQKKHFKILKQKSAKEYLIQKEIYEQEMEEYIKKRKKDHDAAEERYHKKVTDEMITGKKRKLEELMRLN
jgi:hypothetical protein